MTKEEIKDLIAAKIAGQGNQVDIGNALPTVLGAILDAIPTTGLQFGGVLSDGDTIPETPNVFYVAGVGNYYVSSDGEVEEVPVEEGNIAFFIIDAQGANSVQTIAITTGGDSEVTTFEYTSEFPSGGGSFEIDITDKPYPKIGDLVQDEGGNTLMILSQIEGAFSAISTPRSGSTYTPYGYTIVTTSE